MFANRIIQRDLSNGDSPRELQPGHNPGVSKLRRIPVLGGHRVKRLKVAEMGPVQQGCTTLLIEVLTIGGPILRSQQRRSALHGRGA